MKWVEVKQGFSYIVAVEDNVVRVFDTDECPACNGSGKVNPHAILGGSVIEGADVCPICQGDQVVRGRECSVEEIQNVFGDDLRRLHEVSIHAPNEGNDTEIEVSKILRELKDGEDEAK